MSLAFWQTEIIHDDLWVRLIYVAHLSVMNIGRQLWWWWRRSFSCCRLYKNCTVLWTATCIMHTEFPVTFFTVNYAYFQPFYTVCPTYYRTRMAGGPLLHVATIRRNTDTHYRHIPFHFSQNERTRVQISLQYLHWC